MTSSGTNPISFLATILKLEIKNGYADRAVIGGLDRYSRKWVIDNLRQPGSSGKVELASLLRNPLYSSKTQSQRETWVKSVLAVLEDDFSGKSNLKRKASGTFVKSARPTPVKAGDSLEVPISSVKGVGDVMARKLFKLGISTVRDMLYFFPRRFMDFSQKRTVANLEEGKDQTLFAIVWEAGATLFGRMKVTEAVVGDETGNIRAVWFNQPWIARQLKTNDRVALSGRVSNFNNRKVFENPEWEIIEEKELTHTGRLVPVYQLTQGLFPKQVRTLVKNALDAYGSLLPEFLPATIRQRCGLMDLNKAIYEAHYPDDYAMQNQSRRRLAFDELFLLQLGVLNRKREWREDQPGHPFNIDEGVINSMLAALPFQLTGAQLNAIKEICDDLSKSIPMSRLLQGDVGSGKTVVATIALLIAIQNGYQGALMAPTEILAGQHFATLSKLLSATTSECSKQGNIYTFGNVFSHDLNVALLTGSLDPKEKSAVQDKIRNGEIGIVIGTHALIQKSVHFSKLGLVVIDEQHRFGVLQRTALRQKGFNPHLLVMTATPIPRSLALTLYGDLDISVINEMPPGRLAITTRWLKADERERAYNFIRKQVSNGRQAFIICPLIEESEKLEVKAAVAEYRRLSDYVFTDMKLGLLHGKLKSAQKEEIMCDFKERRIDILVATSIVEVGIDVPNATIMLVEAADRFGLAQLHQFRGRVGRGDQQSYCLLLSENPSDYGMERLRAIEKTSDGFALAEKDLRLRGPGEFFGTRQSGLPDLKMARLSDTPLLNIARTEAKKLFAEDPQLEKTEHRALAMEVNRIWHKSIENN